MKQALQDNEPGMGGRTKRVGWGLLSSLGSEMDEWGGRWVKWGLKGQD